MKLAASALLLATLTAHAGNEVEVDVRCLSATARGKTVQLEWRTVSDAHAGWFGGYVQYRGAVRPIPIVLARTEVTAAPEGRPAEFRYTWLEVANGRVRGEYRLSSQGANVYGFSYRKLPAGPVLAFDRPTTPEGADRCTWD